MRERIDNGMDTAVGRHWPGIEPHTLPDMGTGLPDPVTTPDVSVTRDGSMFLFDPLTEAGTDWILANVHSEPWQWLGNTLCVDCRLAGPLAEGMILAGLRVV